MRLDVEAIRKQFPALQREVAGRPAVFADAPGGTQAPQVVIDAMSDYLSNSNANQGGAFVTSVETDRVIAGARSAAADFLGCDAGEVAFGPNMTTLTFALARSLARDLTPDDEVVVTRLDHDANIAPWLTIAEDKGATVKWVDITEDCRLDLGSLDAALSERTKIVAFTLASNAVGTVTEDAEVLRRIRNTDAIAVADAVHFAPHRLIDVAALDVDVLFCSPYKFFGPHLGVMYARRSFLDAWAPYKVRPSSNESPSRWETGTQNHEALAGVTACVDYIASLGDGDDRRACVRSAMGAMHAHEDALAERFLEGVRGLDGVTLYGLDSVEGRTPTFALRVAGLSPREVAETLGERGVFVWDGNYYALAVMEALDLERDGGAVRIGFCHYHSLDDVDYVLSCLSDLR